MVIDLEPAKTARERILNAFFDLLGDKPYQKITVSALISAADVNRSTFYAHYDNFEDMRDKLFQQYLDGFAVWLRAALADEFLRDPLPHLTTLGDYVEQNRSLLSAFLLGGVRSESGYGFGMAVREALLPVLGKVSTRRLLLLDLICSALTSVYFTWFVGSYGELSLAEVNEAAARVIAASDPTERK